MREILEILICVRASERRRTHPLNKRRGEDCAKTAMKAMHAFRATDCRETPRNWMCRWWDLHILIFSYVCAYARLIFHSISTRIATRLTVAKRAVGALPTKGGNSKADRIQSVIAPLNREYRGDSFPSLFSPSSALFPFLSGCCFLYQRAREREREHLSLLYMLPAMYAVCKSRRECVSVRITNRKRFSYLPFIKRNEHVRIDIRPISVSTLASAVVLPCCRREPFFHRRALPFFFYIRAATATRLHERNKSSST